MKIAFWVVFVVGCLWVAFAPHMHISSPPSITVKVQQPPPQTEETQQPEQQAAPPSGGEEQTPQISPAPNEGVLVPVVPEAPQTQTHPGHAPKIAIVIDDVGPDLKGSERAIQLPAPITLSFLPYAVRVSEQAKEAREGGHELLLHMPMEPVGHEDPGPGALLVTLPMNELQQRFENALSSFTGFDGVNNHMGSKFTAYADGMHMVVDELQQRHLFYLDSRTSAQSVGLKIAKEQGLPSIGRDIFLDDDPAPEAIRKQLEATMQVARRKGYAVAIGHPHATTMDVMDAWVKEAPEQGFKLVPLKSLVEGE